MNGIERSGQSSWGQRSEVVLAATTLWSMEVKEASRKAEGVPACGGIV